MSLEETKEKREWYKHAFECKKSAYEIVNQNDMKRINDNEVNKVYKCDLLHNVINPPKRIKNIDIHYFPILHGFMNTRKGKVKFNIFRIILESGCSSTV